MRRDLKFKMQVRAVQLSMLLMNKNVKNLKKKILFPSFIMGPSKDVCCSIRNVSKFVVHAPICCRCLCFIYTHSFIICKRIYCYD